MMSAGCLNVVPLHEDVGDEDVVALSEEGGERPTLVALDIQLEYDGVTGGQLHQPGQGGGAHWGSRSCQIQLRQLARGQGDRIEET